MKQITPEQEIYELVQRFSSQGIPCPMLMAEVLKLNLSGKDTVQRLRAYCAQGKNTDTDKRRRMNWQQLFVLFSQNLVTVQFRDGQTWSKEGGKEDIANVITIATEMTGVDSSQVIQIWFYDPEVARSPGARSPYFPQEAKAS